MRRRPVIVMSIAAIVLAWVSSTVAQIPEPAKPAVTLHKTASASFFRPAKSSVLFMLIIGSDIREGDPRTGRADSIHILALDPKKGRGTLIGIPRDSYVPVPGLGSTKINASLATGGPRRTVETVKQMSGLPISYWAVVDFSRFRRVVDALGGVKVKVPYKMADPFSGAFFEPGPRKMNGVEALAFARNRKTVPGGDFGRSENQGRLLLAGLAKFRDEAASPVRIAKYLSTFRSLVASNVPTRDMIDLAMIAARTDPAKIVNVVVPGHGGSAGSASVVLLEPGAYEMFRKVKADGIL